MSNGGDVRFDDRNFAFARFKDGVTGQRRVRPNSSLAFGLLLGAAFPHVSRHISRRHSRSRLTSLTLALITYSANGAENIAFPGEKAVCSPSPDRCGSSGILNRFGLFAP
jgi:hypothetical protein